MQILYWHLRRPRRSSFGGQVHSPPLLQRSTSVPRVDDFENSLLDTFEGDGEDEIMAMQDQDTTAVMDFDEEGMPTVFYLNVDQFIQENDQEVLHQQHELGSIVTTTNNGITTTSQGGIQFVHQNGLSEGITIYQGNQSDNDSSLTFHSATVSNIQQGNKRKVNDDEDDEEINQDQDALVNGYIDDSSSSSNSLVKKRPKLVINLYEESRGYEIGCQLLSSDEEDDDDEDLATSDDKPKFTQLSQLIPYSEDSILRSVDREEIPEEIISSRGDDIQWTRGHLIAKIRDFRRFNNNSGPSTSRSSSSSSSFKNNNNNITNHFQNSRFTKLNNKQSQPLVSNTNVTTTPPEPIVREVVLRPTTQSILTDFDRLIEKSIKDRKKWKVSHSSLSKPNQNQDLICNNNDNENSDGSGSDSDSEFEFELDMLSSLDDECDELSYDQRLELEKEFVNKSSDSLCLDPSPVVGLIANRAQFERLKWKESKPKKVVKSYDIDEKSEYVPNARLASFHQFVQRVKDRVGSIKDLEPFKLPAMPCLDNPPLDPPKNLDDIIKLGQKPEAASLRILSIDNFVKKIEEYTLETERRKRPHTTKLSIYQRNGMDSYFGELEMESFLDGPTLHSKPLLFGNGKSSDPATASTKCQFELGSSRSVALYVKQFSDIFTEDGRRPCKITYQKVGQPQPQVLYTNSYKPAVVGQAQASAAAATAGPSSAAVNANAAINSRQVSNTTPTAQVTAASATPSQPPVQIVHPQPRTVQLQSASGSTIVVSESGTTGQVQVYASSANNNSQSQQQQIQSQNASMNFNVNLNSGAGATPQQHQILTRPQIVSVNLQHTQQQSPGGIQGQSNIRPSTAHQQLLQQRLLRMKQQQQQAQQQPQATTALAKLLLTNLQQNSSGSRPITVAVQPQPQTANSLKGNNPSDGQQQQVTVNPSALMISSPSVVGGQSSQSPNISVNSSNLNLNLNTITLDNLLSSSASAGSMGSTNLISATSTNHLRVGSNVTTGQGNMSGAVNILRVNSTASGAGGGLSTGAQTLQRQLTMNTVSNVSTGNVSILQTSQPQQRILINANSGQQIGSVTLAGNSSGDVEELSVPDLNSLLAAGSGSTVQIGGGQTQTIMASSNHHQSTGLSQIATQTPTVDTHNLNLNLNVNLNSGTTVVGDSSHSQLQATSQGPPPFLVFISPLRSVPVPMGGSSGVNRQQMTTLPAGATVVSSASPSTLSLNLGTAVQQSIQQQQANMDSIVTSLASSNNVITVPSLSNNTQHNNNTVVSTHNVSSTGEVIDGVDSIFNALSEAIGPELGQKLDGLGSSTVMIGNTPYSVSVSSGGSTELRRSQISPAIVSNSQGSIGGQAGSKKDSGNSSVITLSDLLAPSTSSTNSSNLSSLILNSSGMGGHSPSIMVSSPQSSVSSTSSNSVVSSTPRLSALLAGSPSADSVGSLGGSRLSRLASSSPLSSPTSLTDSSSGGSLLDRLAASLTHSQLNSNQNQQQRTGGSGLNPIATATPSVVLEHPVLAATLTGQQQQSPRGVSAYRQIAPAPTSTSAGLNRKH